MGKKHKKAATHDIHRQPKREPVEDAGVGESRAVELLNNAIDACEAASSALNNAEALSDSVLADVADMHISEESSAPPEKSQHP